MRPILTDVSIIPKGMVMKAEDIFQIATLMQGTAEGISLQDIQQEFSVSRRTAERLRDAVMRTFPHCVEIKDGREKRWKIPNGSVNSLMSFTAEELSVLQHYISVSKTEGNPTNTNCLTELLRKVEALQPDKIKRRVSTDLEVLAEADGIAMRPGPRPHVNEDVFIQLREAILSCSVTNISYLAVTSKKIETKSICPYGFLYGPRNYLVAHSEQDNSSQMKLYRLSNIHQANTSGNSFVKDDRFNLRAYTEKSFGVYQEKPFRVVWRFKPIIAHEASEFSFHPNQETKHLSDGSFEVSFTAGGTREMLWHLFTWGDNVEVIEPKDWNQRVCALEDGYR